MVWNQSLLLGWCLLLVPVRRCAVSIAKCIVDHPNPASATLAERGGTRDDVERGLFLRVGERVPRLRLVMLRRVGLVGIRLKQKLRPASRSGSNERRDGAEQQQQAAEAGSCNHDDDDCDCASVDGVAGCCLIASVVDVMVACL